MKNIWIAGLAGMALFLAACSAHRVRCRGALQPINKPAAVASQSKDVPTEHHP